LQSNPRPALYRNNEIQEPEPSCQSSLCKVGATHRRSNHATAHHLPNAPCQKYRHQISSEGPSHVLDKLSRIIVLMAPDARSPTEGHNPTPCDGPPFAARRQRSMPTMDCREKPTPGRRHSLMTFPPGAGKKPSQRPANVHSYLFGTAHAGIKTDGAMLTAAQHTFAIKHNKPSIWRSPPEPHSVSQKTFSRTSAAPRARPCSCPAICTDDESCPVQGHLGSALKDQINLVA